MSKSHLDAALAGEAWSLSGVVFGLTHLSDDERRPLFEERAPIEIREEIDTLMRPCPYRDERFGRSMNISALAQVARHLDAVVEDVARFRATLPPVLPTWDDLCLVAMDQLCRPAVYLLDHRSRSGPIPADLAVGYKLAIGYTTPIRKLLTLEARGQPPEVSVESLQGLIREERLLVGAREVCAAPMSMVTRVSDVLVNGVPSARGEVEPRRQRIALALTLQFRVGVVWGLFDLAAERRLLVEQLGSERLKPRNAFSARMLAERLVELEQPPGGDAEGILPSGLSPSATKRLQAVRRSFVEGDRAPADAATAIDTALGYDDSSIALTDPEARGLFAHNFVAYLRARQTFIAVLGELEMVLRQELEFPPEVPFDVTGAILPMSRCLRWFEMITGYRIRPSPASSAELLLRNHHRTITLPVPE